MERIRQRNRNVESGVELDYLKALYEEYQEFIQDISRTVPVIRVDWEQYRDASEMAEVIKREYFHQSFIRDVSWSPTRS